MVQGLVTTWRAIHGPGWGTRADRKVVIVSGTSILGALPLAPIAFYPLA